MKRIILGALAALGGFIIVVLFLAFTMTSGLPKAADQFFAHIVAGDVETAYTETADFFKENTTYEDFAAGVDYYNLNLYESSTWNSRSVENDLGELSGTITLSDGSVYTSEMQFTKEDGAWRVNFLSVEYLVRPEESQQQ
jgi:hypothetical protein